VTDLPVLAAVELTPADPSLPLLLVGPSLGTSAEALWSACAAELTGQFHVVGWDLPGHGRSQPARASFSVDDLAEAVWRIARRVLADRGDPDGTLHVAGDSLGGAVTLAMLLARPAWRFRRATLLSTGARIGTPSAWSERAAQVRAHGTVSLLDATPARWFGPGFADRSPQVAGRLLAALAEADDASYAWACEALAAFDERPLLAHVDVPVTAVAGAHDVVTPAADLEAVAGGVRQGRLEVLDVGHLAPAEAPGALAGLLAAAEPAGTPGEPPLAELTLAEPILGERAPGELTLGELGEAGLAVRRAVLGDAHVDRSLTAATDVTSDFQQFIARYAWGAIWTRPGLDRRQRSLITLTALVALGHHEELELHLHGALRNGLSRAEISEALLQTAIYCGVPAANSAFRVAQRVLGDERRPES
jgi:3-oxoadipate enol-lactonase/4-carboxymuconolactone decarboxylase